MTMRLLIAPQIAFGRIFFSFGLRFIGCCGARLSGLLGHFVGTAIAGCMQGLQIGDAFSAAIHGRIVLQNIANAEVAQQSEHGFGIKFIALFDCLHKAVGFGQLNVDFAASEVLAFVWRERGLASVAFGGTARQLADADSGDKCNGNAHGFPFSFFDGARQVYRVEVWV